METIIENNYNYIHSLMLYTQGKVEELQSFTGLSLIEYKQQMCDFLVNTMKWKTRQVAEVLQYAITTVRKYCKTVKCTIIEFLKKAYQGAKDFLRFKKTGAYAYLIYLRDKETNNIKWLKVGKAVDLRDRHSTLSRKYNANIEMIEKYHFNSEEQAYTMEDMMRNYYRALNNDIDFVPNDRFTLSRATKKDLQTFKQYQEKVIWRIMAETRLPPNIERWLYYL